MNLESYNIFIISLKNFFSNAKKNYESLLPKLMSFGAVEKNIHVVGVNGCFLQDKKINKRYIDEKVFPFKKQLGTLGCALSHALVLKLIKIKNIKNDVLVFEDDVVINEKFFSKNEIPIGKPGFLNEVFDYDFIFLHQYHINNFFAQKKEFEADYFRRIVLPCDFEIGKIEYPFGFAPGCTAMMFNGSNIDKIIDNILPFKNAVDFDYSKPSDFLKTFYLNPDLRFFLNPGFSNVSARHIIDISTDQQIKDAISIMLLKCVK